MKKIGNRNNSWCFTYGHALSIKNPDIPYASWKYGRNSQVVEVNNLEERFLPAAKIFLFS
ncbi:DUF6765 family protein [Halanaerobium congolense]|uniref:DUF6765 family protein n=1 Tax=Halanaerobium congolense TaxID=54121 RepID=UPI003B849456